MFFESFFQNYFCVLRSRMASFSYTGNTPQSDTKENVIFMLLEEKIKFWKKFQKALLKKYVQFETISGSLAPFVGKWQWKKVQLSMVFLRKTAILPKNCGYFTCYVWVIFSKHNLLVWNKQNRLESSSRNFFQIWIIISRCWNITFSLVSFCGVLPV